MHQIRGYNKMLANICSEKHVHNELKIKERAINKIQQNVHLVATFPRYTVELYFAIFLFLRIYIHFVVNTSVFRDFALT